MTQQSASISNEMDKLAIEPENTTQTDTKKPYNDLKKRSKARNDSNTISHYITSVPKTQQSANNNNFLDLRPPSYTQVYGDSVPDFDEYVKNVQKLLTKQKNKSKWYKWV